jgi:hypothetical protein
MGVVISSFATITDSPAGTPLIGYQSVISEANVSSLSATAGFPITNIANPATHLYWKGAVVTGSEAIDVAVNGQTIDYMAIAGHNLGSAGISFSISDTNSPATTLLNSTTVADDKPIIIRLPSGLRTTVRLSLAVHDTLPQIAVMYLGQILVLERGIKVDVEFIPIVYGRKTNVVNGMSESGNFLGRVVLSESRETKAEFFAFTPTFYRASVDPFIVSAQEDPFFWAWAPSDYPLETGFAWLTTDAQPRVSPDHRRIALTLQMAGLA